MSTILIVDNSWSFRGMLSFTLKGAGNSVVEAIAAPDALNQVNSREIDFVITDHDMPNLDGIRLTTELRATPKFGKTPILILTTESSDQMKQAGRTAGANGWMVKPFDPAKLIEVIRKILSTPR